MSLWTIYHRDRECARTLGDPDLGIVNAPTKDAAEARALVIGLAAITGPWAVPLRLEGPAGDGEASGRAVGAAGSTGR